MLDEMKKQQQQEQKSALTSVNERDRSSSDLAQYDGMSLSLF